MKRFFLPLILALLTLASCDDTTQSLGTSIADINDQLDYIGKSFSVKSETVVADSVLGRASVSSLGRIKDPETGTYITCNMMTQFSILDDEFFPSEDSIYDEDIEAIMADSAVVYFYLENPVGDTLSPMKATLYEMDHPMTEKDFIYSSFSPVDNGYVRQDDNAIKMSQTFTFSDLTDSERGYTSILTFPLKDRYVAKDGKEYSNYGSYVLNKYFEDPNNFHNSYTFINNVCPGFFLETSGGIGCMSDVYCTRLIVYYREIANINKKDTIVNAYALYTGTDEVLQTTEVKQDKKRLEELKDDNSCTYIKSPAGLFTQLTLPVNEIMTGHDNDTLNAAKMFIPRYNNETLSSYNLPTPSTLLVLPSDSIKNFFEKGHITDNRKSYLVKYDSSKNGYSFNNISALIAAMYKSKQEYLAKYPGMTAAEYENTFPNWNKVTLIPVTTNYTTISSSEVLTRVSNDMTMNSVKLMGGKANPDLLQINVIYSKYKTAE